LAASRPFFCDSSRRPGFGRIRQSTLLWIKRWALALVAAQVSYVLLDIFILMRSAGFTLAEVIGANFVLAGALSTMPP